jgi:hypothetical protein
MGNEKSSNKTQIPTKPLSVPAMDQKIRIDESRIQKGGLVTNRQQQTSPPPKPKG